MASHATFAEAPQEAVMFMAKFDIKDGFWQLYCQEGQEWNFAFVLPQPAGAPIKLVIPTSLQMGWVESPPNFCAASEMVKIFVVIFSRIPQNGHNIYQILSSWLMTTLILNSITNPKTLKE